MRNLATSLLFGLASASALAQDTTVSTSANLEAPKALIESTSKIGGILGDAAKAATPTVPTIAVRRTMNQNERMANQKLCDEPAYKQSPICAESR